MIQSSDSPSFLLEAAKAFRISSKGSGQDLDGHIAAEAGIARTIDLSHAARAKGARGFRKDQVLCLG